MIIGVAVLCLVMGMVIGTVIQVAFPQHPREMWRGLKIVLGEYIQGYKDINTSIKEYNKKDD